jgi:hypothetical protein
MTRRRRNVEVVPRRIEEPTHVHSDDCKLTTRDEFGNIVVYRGRKAVLDWLNRVADLARERGGYARSAELSARAARPTVDGSAVQATAHQPAAPTLSCQEVPPDSGRTTPRRDPAVTSS